MPSYLVRLAVDGVDPFDEALIEASFEAALTLYWGSSDGQAHVRAMVDAETATWALQVILKRLHSVAPAARPSHVLEDWVSISDIADRAGVSRETVRLWANGERQREFPRPRGVVSRQQRIWDWPTVDRWLKKHIGIGDEYELPSQSDITRMNEVIKLYNTQQVMASGMVFTSVGCLSIIGKPSISRPLRPVAWSERGGATSTARTVGRRLTPTSTHAQVS